MKDTNKIFYLLLFVLALAVNFAGINANFFTDDPGLYASIAKNLVYKKTFFELFTYNEDWLDKPHFPFWAILISYKLLGISVWAYRLPALLFFLLSLLYTFLFTRKFYNSETAAIAVLILMTALNVQLSNTDVRAEPYLMALLTGSIYHVARLRERYTFNDLFLAALLTACAIMTKGIFVIVAIYGSLFGQLIFQKRLKDVFQFRWLSLIIVTLIFTLPEFYALYTQFDLHPEKTVFGTHHVSGIKWFLWDSQFGRFVNNGPIVRKASGSVFFFIHTLLWAFAPWCLLFYYAAFKNIKAIFDKNPLPEYYAISGGLLMLVLFSISRFQLPFYTNSVFPLFAIITAPFCYRRLNKFETKFMQIAQWTFVVLLIMAVVLLDYLLKPASELFFAIDIILFIAIVSLVVTRVIDPQKRVFILSCTTALIAGFYVNTVLYDEITPYKGQITAAKYVNKKLFEQYHIYTLRSENNIFQFYCTKPVDYIPLVQFKNFKPGGLSVFYINQPSMDYLTANHASFKVIKSFINYPQENLLPKFINAATRSQTLDHVYLITK